MGLSFGSMIHQASGRIYQMVLDALGKTGKHTVVLSGPGKRSTEHPADILVMDAFPRDWLLPRYKAIIHHGALAQQLVGSIPEFQMLWYHSPPANPSGLRPSTPFGQGRCQVD